jgi:hypothetical protein
MEEEAGPYQGFHRLARLNCFFSLPAPFVAVWIVLTIFSRAVVTDPEDPRFDLEKLIAKWERSS